MEIVTILLFALGHLFRDGSPATGHTHVARWGGAFLCGLGALAILAPWEADLVGLAMLVGFYVDQKHAKGQDTRGWKDAAYLAWSGVTSLVPLAALAAYICGPWTGLAALAGLAKPAIWFGCAALKPARWWAPAYPTRVAATLFGALAGLLAWLMSTLDIAHSL